MGMRKNIKLSREFYTPLVKVEDTEPVEAKHEPEEDLKIMHSPIQFQSRKSSRRGGKHSLT